MITVGIGAILVVVLDSARGNLFVFLTESCCLVRGARGDSLHNSGMRVVFIPTAKALNVDEVSQPVNYASGRSGAHRLSLVRPGFQGSLYVERELDSVDTTGRVRVT